jgi:hypothetical protein
VTSRAAKAVRTRPSASALPKRTVPSTARPSTTAVTCGHGLAASIARKIKFAAPSA